MFITFEGSNGVGKTTVINAVVERLRRSGLDIFLTKEPTKSSLGNLLKSGEETYYGESLACLAAADRYFHIESEVKPSLQSGMVAISDRYVESSLVLQRLDGCSLDFIWGLHSNILVPDMSIILFAKPETIKQRMLLRNAAMSRFEREKSREMEVSFYRDAAIFLAAKGFNVVSLNNEDLSVEQMGKSVSEMIQQLINQKDEDTQ